YRRRDRLGDSVRPRAADTTSRKLRAKGRGRGLRSEEQGVKYVAAPVSERQAYYSTPRSSQFLFLLPAPCSLLPAPCSLLPAYSHPRFPAQFQPALVAQLTGPLLQRVVETAVAVVQGLDGYCIEQPQRIARPPILVEGDLRQPQAN